MWMNHDKFVARRTRIAARPDRPDMGRGPWGPLRFCASCEALTGERRSGSRRWRLRVCRILRRLRYLVLLGCEACDVILDLRAPLRKMPPKQGSMGRCVEGREPS